MKRKLIPAALILLLLLLLGGCAPQAVDPLLKNETTDAAGLAMNVFPATAGEDNVDLVTATLYFRYLDEPLLASESRTLNVARDESVEFAIIRALVEGPSAEHGDLRRLIPANTKVESVVSRDDTLFVTFNEGFLADGVPDDWATNETWQQEAPLMRKLIAQSIVASVTEGNPYTGLQILVHKHGETQTSLRLENTYFLTGATGLSEPVTRDETLLLTPQRTAETILTAWSVREYTRLYQYVTETDRPSLAWFSETLSSAPPLTRYTVCAGSVTQDGQIATVTAALYTLGDQAEEETVAYPIPLVRENGVWKITFAHLRVLMAR
ncbi:MAG: GerMN domain-containing protein [Eubacteriales bacterium]|nr:GerMN domain-containing protein [Eubacteriales bacterium]